MTTLAPIPTDDVLAAAIALGSWGVRVTPCFRPLPDGGCSCRKPECGSIGKHPIPRGWQRTATSEEQAIRDQWASIRGETNVGIVMGQQPNGEFWVAVDVDDAARLSELEEEFGPLPETLTCSSGRGERRFFVAGPDVPLERLKNKSGIGGKPGVDFKAANGQVVVGPSLHSSGKRYEWRDPLRSPSELPATWARALLEDPRPPQFTYTPSQLRTDARARKRMDSYLQKAVTGEAGLVARCSKGLRNTHLYQSVFRLGSLVAGTGVPGGFEFVQREMLGAAKAAGLMESEASSTIQSALKGVRESGAMRVPQEVKDPAAWIAPPSQTAAASSAADSSASGFEAGGESIELISDRGQPAGIAENVVRLLSKHSAWKGGPRHDAYSNMVVWPEGCPVGRKTFSRHDLVTVQAWCLRFGLRVALEAAELGVRSAAQRYPTDTLREWLESLPPWDGKPRLDSWLHLYLGCPDDEYTRLTGRAWLRAAVERALEPGLLVDIVPVLVGPQSAGKNRALSILFASPFGAPAPWMGTLVNFDPTSADLKRLATTRWVLMDDEFHASKPKHRDAIKSWISQTHEQYVAKYENDLTTAPRRAILTCSTNEAQFLYDSTGNRRFLIWRVGTIDHEALARDRVQLLAEALASKASWRENQDRFAELSTAEAAEVEASDPMVETLMQLEKDGKWKSWLSSGALAGLLGVSPERADQAFATRLGAAAKRIGAESRRLMVDGVRVRAYAPKSLDQANPG